jgi:protein SFI1
MSRFRPARASSPPKLSSKRSAITVSDILDRSTSSVPALAPELAALTPQEIDFLDAVIQRAGPSGSTFLTVFKVYSELLQERGIDSEQEVVIYSKLLKVGTIKGKNWGEKWDFVKKQQQPQAGPSRPRLPPPPPPGSVLAAPRAQILSRLTGTLKAFEKDDDAFTLHSHQDEMDATESEVATETELDHNPRLYSVTARTATTTTRRPVSPTLTVTTNSLGLSVNTPPSSFAPRTGTPAYKAAAVRQPYRTPGAWDAESSEATAETAHASSSVPPSYGAATRDSITPVKSLPSNYTPLRALAKAQSQKSDLSPTTSHPVPSAARAVVLQARERRGSVLNEDDAWKKIKMARDEEDADRFREERILERCWEVWRQAYHWILVSPSIPFIDHPLNLVL